ncbi:hypothetical protein [Gordonia polyisoprenivorans]|uniref:hypothetical protein n=1 Tax=Gordonia polyisoprenivorans TaxID=84595 RepID=UPI001AD65A81|nr:hypothetical protein [Gordonia polyisoprenivorans]QTI70565.1 hypothetical protein J6U32_08460 [Gordonia polyisoprenivorans]
MVEARWRLVRCAPTADPNPGVLDDEMSSSIEVTAPGPVAHMVAGTFLEPTGPDTVDDLDWWLVADVVVEAPVVLDCAGLTPPGAVFVDREHAADVESMFLPVRVTVPVGVHEIAIWSGSLRKWLSRRRPRGRWRSTLVAAQGMRWARTSLLGRAPVYGGVPPVVGAWRPLTFAPAGRFDQISLSVDADSGAVAIRGRLLTTDAVPEMAGAIVEILDDSGTVLAASGLSVDLFDGSGYDLTGQVTVGGHRRWYPHGHGAPITYRVRITAGGVSSERIIGFRTITADQHDGAFALSVNGIDVFCRGAVWVPPEPCTMTASRQHIEDQLLVLRDAGANMVRVMGGFVPEQPEFYDLCAELGILVWQDAMLTTFDPPAELDDVVCAEMEHLLTGISGNPALAVVSGGSESLQQPEMMGLDAGSLSIPLIDTMLRDVAGRLAGVPYVVASPSSWGENTDDTTPLAIRSDTGIAHWFGVGGYLNPLDAVRTAGVRFAAESLAFAIPPSDDAIEADFGSLAVAGHHPDWKRRVPRDRTATWDFEDVRDFYVREVFGVDPLQVRRTDPARYLQLGRLAVAEAMAACYRFWRRRDSGCAGALVLNAKDLRPGAGWGLLDHRGTAKLPLAALTRVWAPVALLLDDAGQQGIRIDLYNDTGAELSGALQLRAVDDAGTVVAQGEAAIVIKPHASVTRVDTDLIGHFTDLSHAYRFGPPVATALLAEFVVDEQLICNDVLVLHPSDSPIRSGLTAVRRRLYGSDTWQIEVRAEASVRYVCVDAPGWVLSDNCFHLAAGQPHLIEAMPAAPSRGTGDRAEDGSGRVPNGKVTSVDARETAVLIDAVES